MNERQRNNLLIAGGIVLTLGTLSEAEDIRKHNGTTGFETPFGAGAGLVGVVYGLYRRDQFINEPIIPKDESKEG